VGAAARGYAAGREELGLGQSRDLLSGTMEEFHLQGRRKRLFLLIVWQGTWWVNSLGWSVFRADI